MNLVACFRQCAGGVGCLRTDFPQPWRCGCSDPGNSLLLGSVLCSVECLAALLASSYLPVRCQLISSPL